MVTLIFNFLQEQGILIVLGLMAAGGIFSQWMASRRFRKLRAGIQSLAALQAPSAGGQTVAGQAGKDRTSQMQIGAGRAKQRQVSVEQEEISRTEEGRRRSLRDRFGDRHSGQAALGDQESARETVHTPTQMSEQEMDSQLLYLKQSLDRIAAGRDQKLEEEAREHRKLTPEQEAIIADILREYLS